MKPATVYGIKNCDTMKKAFAWLDAAKADYVFHDYKKLGADAAVLKRAVKQHGWENVINRKGTTWRALDDKVKAGLDEKSALALALENPSLIKRPLLARGEDILLGFDAAAYAAFFDRKQLPVK